nr:MAG TPA: hypothetical protein [Caudoviricetes sp.]
MLWSSILPAPFVLYLIIYSSFRNNPIALFGHKFFDILEKCKVE